MCWVCARHIVFLFDLIWSEHPPPYIWGVAYMPFGKLKTCFLFLTPSKDFSGHSSMKPSSMEWTASFGPMDRYFSLCCGTLQLLQGYLWSLCCLSDWCPPCSVCEFWWAALSWQVCCGTMFFPFEDDEFDGAPGDHQSFGYFFITQPWPVWRAPWSSWWDASCLVVLQPLGPFRKGVFKLTEHVTLRLQTGGLHFTNYDFWR